MSICLRRREFIVGLGGAAAWPLGARAQQRRVRLPTVGVLWSSGVPFSTTEFREGLVEKGFVIGETVAIHFEFNNLQFSRLSAQAAALVERRVDVIVAGHNIQTIRAAQSATTTIPIVFSYGGDPVEDAFIASLNRPGGNLTGVTELSTELTGKRLGLLHELLPGAMTVGFLTQPLSRSKDRVLAAAQSLGIAVLILEASNEGDIEYAFMEAGRRRAEALMVDNTTLNGTFTRTIVALAERYRVPTMYPFLDPPRLGGLICYSSVNQSFGQIGFRQIDTEYVARILQGSKPNDLPVQQPTRFKVVINMKTAKALGLSIPAGILIQADEVIE
jgi:putative ABC transport system substrate-binding protein